MVVTVSDSSFFKPRRTSIGRKEVPAKNPLVKLIFAAVGFGFTAENLLCRSS